MHMLQTAEGCQYTALNFFKFSSLVYTETKHVDTKMSVLSKCPGSEIITNLGNILCSSIPEEWLLISTTHLVPLLLLISFGFSTLCAA